MAAVEAGIKTFLIADVRGYTWFTQERGDEAAARLATRLRRARDRQGGRRPGRSGCGRLLRPVGSDFPGGQGPRENVAYTPDGRYLFAAYGDGTADPWPVSQRAWEQHACAVAGRNFTHEEWQRFVGGGYSAACPQHPVPTG